MSDITPKVDVTRLAHYVNKISELASVTKLMAPVYLQDMIVGQDVAANILAKATKLDSEAKSKLEYAESIAYLERAADYLASKNIKDTSEAKKQYVNIDPDVIKAKDHKAYTEAMVVLIRSRLSELRQAHDDLKKITYDKNTDTQWEGM